MNDKVLKLLEDIRDQVEHVVDNNYDIKLIPSLAYLQGLIEGLINGIEYEMGKTQGK